MPVFRLYVGNKSTGITVQPDANWPTMWRVHMPSGQVSDMVSLSRAKEAARQVSEIRSGGVDVKWKTRASPPEAPPIAPSA